MAIFKTGGPRYGSRQPTMPSSTEVQQSLKPELAQMSKALGVQISEDEDMGEAIGRITRMAKCITRMDLTHLYESKALADCTLRVIIGPDSDGEEQSRSVKRPRVDSPNGAASDAVVRVIDVNSGVLAPHSRYLLSALSGTWAESPKRVIDICVPSEEAFADLELLVKLCYGPSYVIMDSKPVDRDVLFRLLPLADSLEFVAFVDAVLDALCDGLTLQEVYMAFQCIPHTLWEDERLKGFWEEAAGVVAEGMPYLHEVVGAGQLCASMDGLLPLSASVKDALQELPPFFLEYLLPSEELNILHENDAFSFVMAYLDQHMQAGTQDSAEVERCCERLLPLLRYQHMTRHFIGRVVSSHPRMRERLGMVLGVTHRMSIPDRGTATGDTGTSTHTCSFSVSDDLLPLQPGAGVSRWAGLSFGYPVILTLTRSGDGGSVHVDVMLRFTGAHNDDDRLQVVITLKGRGLDWLQVREERGVDGVSGVRFNEAFEGVPWAEVVGPGSEYVSDGEVKLVLNISVKTR